MSGIDPVTRDAVAEIQALHHPLAEALRKAAAALAAKGFPEEKALAWAGARLIAELGEVLAAAASSNRAADSRTFEAMFDLDDVTSHFQSNLETGLHHAAEKIEHDGYTHADSVLLASTRALDAVSDILAAAAR